ncbi:cytochrome c biogenesis protein ResB [Pseudoclavibacter endophyticus]|uniref:Cytochrome c biogenesis protein ResB n=1 Tax=Pseudoclavibacter endophyticus TaxID=1778590 RepID=A0A6H9WJE3_9MICO|nr:cytochrome c biogenesis protein ResB [Pseudoclavibacter endophyticus]KAB1648936.1 cytochrome c biogenesis protein ResB [Pseudoclavibacter endophyticus]GGA66985.1 cytochrome c biogenesis protein ResB [Pseudoclavibacter endophyticus]
MSRPSDHIDAGRDGFEHRDRPRRTAAGGARAGDGDTRDAPPRDRTGSRDGAGASGASGPTLRPDRALATLRTVWRQLTSMRVALLLLLLLAVAAVPGSLVPQRTSDPNGVAQVFDTSPELAEFYDRVGLFAVYSSPWFTAIYLLLFVSLVGCIIPRVSHHWRALRTPPPTTPARLDRFDAYSVLHLDAEAADHAGEIIDEAARTLKGRGYRTVLVDGGRRGISVSAERGYLRETGNLVFHIAMLGVIITVGVLGSYAWHGQRVLVEGQTFVNSPVAYSSFNPGRFFTNDQLTPYSLTLDRFDVEYESANPNAVGAVNDFAANVTVADADGTTTQQTVRVNDPLRTNGTDVYLLGNGYAPQLTVRDADGTPVFSDTVPFLPQDSNLTSLGVVKVPDGLAEQVGMIGFFYPTAATLDSGALTSSHPDLGDPVLTLNVYTGDLGLDDGVPMNVYSLDTDDLTQVAGGETGVESLQLQPGETTELPGGLGSIELGEIPRYASFDIHDDPTQVPMLVFAALCVGGLVTGLFVPRRRMWVKAVTRRDGTLLVEYAGLARGDDPQLAGAVNDLLDAHADALVGWGHAPSLSKARQ